MENMLNFEQFSTNEEKKAKKAKGEKFVPFWVKKGKGKDSETEEKGEKPAAGKRGLTAKQKKLPPAFQAAILKKMNG